jgi:hypothetical protein
VASKADRSECTTEECEVSSTDWELLKFLDLVNDNASHREKICIVAKKSNFFSCKKIRYWCHRHIGYELHPVVSDRDWVSLVWELILSLVSQEPTKSRWQLENLASHLELFIAGGPGPLRWVGGGAIQLVDLVAAFGRLLDRANARDQNS